MKCDTLWPRSPVNSARETFSLAARDLGWRMTHSLRDMVASAWEARQAH